MTSGLGPAGRLGRAFIQSKLTPLLVIAALALGWLAVSLTPREEEPQIVVPMVNVFVGLPGAGPTEVENRVTVPLERRMWQIPGVEYVYSASMPGMALVTVRFLVNEDEERSLVRVYDQLASSLDRMPPGATAPLVRSRSIDDVPVLALTLWSERYDSDELRRVAAELRRELVRVPDVSETRLIGGHARRVRILLDAELLASRELDPLAVAAALGAQNSTAPAGSFESDDVEVLVETGAFLRTVDEVASLVVGVHRGGPVYLREVAEVRDDFGDADSYVQFAAGPGSDPAAAAPVETYGFVPAVTLSLAKRKGADAQRVVDAVMGRVEELSGRLIPPGVEISVTRDYGRTATEKANELLVHLGVAIVSVTLVIGLFLGWRGALVVLLAVPVSFALTLFVYYVLGYTLNRVTLFALVFVTGIVVDDSIIVVENMVRHLAMRRLPPLQASIAAVNEVGNPTILATLTVIAAVLPMAFVRGLMGPYMRPMPVGAALAMTFSLLVALVAAPWLGYRLLRSTAAAHGEEAEPRQSRTYRVYRALVGPLLERPSRRWLFLGGVTLLLLLSVALLPLRWVSVKMLPFDNKSELQLIVDLPEGTTLERTARVARELAEAMLTEPEVANVQLYAGTAAPINFNGLVRQYDLRRGANVADVQVNFVHKAERSAQSHDLAKRIRPRVEEIAARHGAAVKIAEVPPGPPVLSTLVAEIYGPNDTERRALAARVKEIFERTEGVVDTDWWIEAPQPKRLLQVDRERAVLHGVAPAAAARALRLALTGEEVGLLHDEREAEPVALTLELPRTERSSIDGLGRLRLLGAGGALVRLGELVRVDEAAREPNRYRKNLRPVVYVTGDVAGRQESPAYAMLEMSEQIAEMSSGGAAVEQLYSGTPVSEESPVVKWNGEWQITYEVFRDLGAAFGAVLILIYFLIVGWFRSFAAPLVMMIAIPLSLVGILPAHWLFGAFFTATSMIGFIALAGIMVRNSVLLIDFVNLARERGVDLAEAVIEAGAVRFRPILLTAGTVVVGALVILFDPIFQGLAIALMAGAVASTVLTLGVVPVTYFMLEGRKPESE